MRKIVITSLVVALLCGIAISLSADAPAGAPGDTPRLGGTEFEAEVAELKAMPANERRAVLEGMSPEERRGLWFSVKRSLHADRGKSPSKYSEMDGKRIDGRTERLQTRALGTITYDDGVITTSFGGGAIVGNRFDTHTGIPVFGSGTVETVQAVVVPGSAITSSSAGFVLLGPQTTMGGANAIFSTFTAGLTAATETVTFAGLGVSYTGSSFFVLFGDFASSYVPAFGSGSTLGQGFHGVVGYTGGMGPNITGTSNLGGTLNGLVRATGNIVPVELMTFGIE